MINVFSGTNPPIISLSDLHGRNDYFPTLRDHIINRRSSVLLGPEGIGKSSVLNTFFNRQFRQEMAQENKLLIKVTDFPIDRDSDGVYQYLADAVIRAIDMLKQEETMDVYTRLTNKCDVGQERFSSKASMFQSVCEAIQEEEYNIVLVIDGFEKFIYSPYVTAAHHSMLNELISKNLSFVVATNYDFNIDTLPTSIHGSLFLQKFSGNELLINGRNYSVPMPTIYCIVIHFSSKYSSCRTNEFDDI